MLVFHKHPLFLPPSFFLLTPALSLSLSLSLAEVGVAAAGLLPVTQLYAVLMELLRDANTAWIFPALHFPFRSSPPPATPSLLFVTPPTYQSASFGWPLSKSLCSRDIFYSPYSFIELVLSQKYHVMVLACNFSRSNLRFSLLYMLPGFIPLDYHSASLVLINGTC